MPLGLLMRLKRKVISDFFLLSQSAFKKEMKGILRYQNTRADVRK